MTLLYDALFASLINVIIFTNVNCENDFGKYKFPKTFKFGVSTYSYEVEGAWNKDGKTKSIVDEAFHKYNMTIDHSNGDVASDAYYQINDDVKRIKDLGVNFYAFSVSWSRLLPNGTVDKPNKLGIQHYNNLINLLKKQRIEPMIRIGIDIPAIATEIDVYNETFTKYYVDFANFLFKTFGNRVKYWVTLSSRDLCVDYVYKTLKLECARNMLKTHAAMYHLYAKQYKQKQNGFVAIETNGVWFEPSTEELEDKDAASRLMELDLGWFAHPIYSKTGGYSPVFKEMMLSYSKRNQNHTGFVDLTREEEEYIKGTSDFFLLNFITAYLAKNSDKNVTNDTSSVEKYTHATIWQDPKWGNSTTNKIQKCAPWAMRKMLKWIKDSYNNPNILITSHSWSDDGKIYDLDRIKHIVSYLSEVLDSIYLDKVNVNAYFYWSLLDGFTIGTGYTEKRGLYQVNFEDPDRKRTAKSSVNVYKNIIKRRQLPSKFCD